MPWLFTEVMCRSTAAQCCCQSGGERHLCPRGHLILTEEQFSPPCGNPELAGGEDDGLIVFQRFLLIRQPDDPLPLRSAGIDAIVDPEDRIELETGAAVLQKGLIRPVRE